MKRAPRTIAVVTGTRAEYGLLAPVLRAIESDRALALRLVVTGTHLTTKSVKDLAFPVAARVAMQKGGRIGRTADAAALGRGVAGLGEAFARLQPAVVVVLGDRIEAFAAAAAASVAGLRVAHLHGGDRAEGVADEALRHAITKLAHLHLPATKQSRRRIIRMGETPQHVITVGSPGVDGLDAIAPAEDAPEVVVLQHPIGDPDDTEHKHMAGTLSATKHYRRLVLSPNHDPGRNGIVAALRDAGIQPVDHLPRDRFLTLLKGAKAIIGNSSAGLIEAAVLGTPCVNLGPRQAGRERCSNVIDAGYGPRKAAAALREALELGKTRRRFRHPYGDGRTGTRVAELLAAVDLRSIPVRKRNVY